jgi:hypothetical protein
MNSSLTVIGAGHAQSSDANGSVGWGEEGESCAACCQAPRPSSLSWVEVAWNEHEFQVPVGITFNEEKKGNGGTQ